MTEKITHSLRWHIGPRVSPEHRKQTLVVLPIFDNGAAYYDPSPLTPRSERIGVAYILRNDAQAYLKCQRVARRQRIYLARLLVELIESTPIQQEAP